MAFPKYLAKVMVSKFAEPKAEVSAWSFGNLAVVGVPGEPTAAVGRRIEAAGKAAGFKEVTCHQPLRRLVRLHPRARRLRPRRIRGHLGIQRARLCRPSRHGSVVLHCEAKVGISAARHSHVEMPLSWLTVGDCAKGGRTITGAMPAQPGLRAQVVPPGVSRSSIPASTKRRRIRSASAKSLFFLASARRSTQVETATPSTTGSLSAQPSSGASRQSPRRASTRRKNQAAAFGVLLRQFRRAKDDFRTFDRLCDGDGRVQVVAHGVQHFAGDTFQFMSDRQAGLSRNESNAATIRRSHSRNRSMLP